MATQTVITEIVTAEGQVTLGRDMLQHLGIVPGDTITMTKGLDGRVEIAAARGGKISDVFGMFGPTGRPAPTIEEINEAIAAGWAGEP